MPYVSLNYSFMPRVFRVQHYCCFTQLRYTAAWNAALREAYIFSNGEYTQHTCSYHQKTILLTLMNLGARPDSLQNLSSIFDSTGVGCPICNTLCQQRRVLVQTKISQIPKFSALYSDFLGQSTTTISRVCSTYKYLCTRDFGKNLQNTIRV